jgi:hypothetical protein
VYLSALKQLDHVFTQPGTCKEVTTSYMESFRLAFSLGFMGLVFWENMPAGNPIGVLYVNHQLRNGVRIFVVERKHVDVLCVNVCSFDFSCS